GPTAPPLHGRDAVITSLQAIVDTGMTHIEYEPVATRGERHLVAGGATRTDSGFERIFYNTFEYDDTMRQRRVVIFSDDDLEGALDELDERYIAGEGAPHAHIVRHQHALEKAFNRRDWAALEPLFVRDGVVVNHRKLSDVVSNVQSIVD